MDKNIIPDIAQMNSSSILEFLINLNVEDTNECKETISLIWKQLRLLVTKQQNQDEVKQHLQVNQNMQKVILKMSEIVDKNLFHSSSIDSFFFQFIANFITGNATNKDFMVKEFFKQDDVYFSQIQKIYNNSSFKDFKLRKFICTFLYNFIKDQKVEVILQDVLSSLTFQHILKGVLVEFLLNETQSNVEMKNDQTSQIQAQNQEVQVIYWTLILIALLFNSIQGQKLSLFQYFETLFVSQEGVSIQLLESEEYAIKCKGKQYTLVEVISNGIFEKFQLFLFHISQQFIDQKVNNSFVKDLEPTIIDVRCQYVTKKDYKFQISIRDFEYISAQFISIHQNLLNLLNEKKAFELVDVEPLEEEEKQLFTYHLTQLHDKLRMFCMLTFLGGYNSQIQKKMMEVGLYEDVLKMNQHLQQINSLNFDRSKPLIHVNKQCLIYFSNESYQDIFSSIMRLLSNIVHINREGQDFILNNGYLVSCLNQTHMDETNPLQREWSVMLIRNLCDSNDQMQEAISNLKIFEFNDKTKEVLKKYQAKKEELEQIRQSFKDGTLLQDQNKFQNNEDDDDHYYDDSI